MEHDELDKLVICKKCHTLHEKIEIHEGTKALCSNCNTVIYRNHLNIIDTILALSMTALFVFVVGISFDIISINIAGINKEISLVGMIFTLIKAKEFAVGIILSFLLILFPLFINLSLFIIAFWIRFKLNGYLVKRVLIFLSHILHWSMIDIFFISVLVALVKLFGYSQISFGIAFYSLICFLILDIVLGKRVSFNELWLIYEKTYGRG